MPPSKIFLFFCCAFLCGVAASVFVYHGVRPFFLFLIFLGACSIVIFFRKNSAVYIPVIFLIAFLLGMMRATASGVVIGNEEKNISLTSTPVSIEGVVDAEPIITQSRQILPLRVSHITGIEDGGIFKHVRVFSSFIPSYEYGDELYVRCSLLPPRETQSPICVQADIKRISHGKGNRVFSFLLRGKEFFLGGIRTHLSEPHASLLGALLVGERSGFPRWLTDAFVRSGILHIVAISGYNITIMIVSMYAVLRAFSFGRKKSFWCIVCGICCFVLVTGSSASVVRAAFMGVTALFASTIGRKNNATNALVLSASSMVFLQPEILFDIGFQLSFIATCGLVYISPIFERMCEKISDAYQIKTIALQTISATIATAPLLIFSFQRFSLIALAVNMLVLPIIPLVMALGFFWATGVVVFGLLNAVIPISFDLFIQIASWPVWFLLSYIMFTAQWFSQIPWASVDIVLGEWSWVFVYVSYICIAWFVWIRGVILKKKQDMIQCRHVKKTSKT